MPKIGAKGSSTCVAVNRESETPVYQQIVASLRTAIGRGDLLAGERLASTRALSREWGVSRNTVVQVFDTLIAEGFLISRVGDGTYVAEGLCASAKASRRRGATLAREHVTSGRSEYPFRELSSRGRSLVATLSEGLSERPMPFMPDVPDLQEFPMRAWLRMMNEVAGRLTGDTLVEVSAAGYEPLRHAIAHHLRVSRGLRCAPEQVIVTSGSQQGLDLTTRLLVDRGEPVWLEEPGYVGARTALTANGCNVLGVPIDAEGLDVEIGRNQFIAPKLICISPARQYPTGIVMSMRRRAELLAFASQTGAWVLEDDYDSETHFDGAAPPALQSGDASARVIFLGTFSKTLLPSFRLGYVIAPPDLVHAFSTARRVVDRHAPLLEQMVLAEMMNRGLYAAHLRRMRVIYRQRQAALAEVLAEQLGYDAPSDELRSGMHLVLPLAAEADDRALAQLLAERGVVARPLSMYCSARRRRRGLLLGFAAFAPERIFSAGKHLSVLQPWMPSPLDGAEQKSADAEARLASAASR